LDAALPADRGDWDATVQLNGHDNPQGPFDPYDVPAECWPNDGIRAGSGAGKVTEGETRGGAEDIEEANSMAKKRIAA
jgi:hypothetical protein